MKKIIKTIKNKIKSTWDFFNNKKTVIGFLLVIAAKGLKSFTPDLLSHDQIEFIEYLGIGIGSIGGIHKGFKTDYVQKKLKPLIKFTGGFNNSK